jgi:hypothetical protein
MADWFQDPKVGGYLDRKRWPDSTDEALNPATFLEGEAGRRRPTHKCLDVIEYQTKVRPDLRETPLQTGFHFFVGDPLG